ncbi:DUF4363 family protein [Clostridium manihotivorum]|uniref:DUF4363 family protein n=1 Tax=Clostridium manihotivorum TaxID=2320868 RepID=A0A3R5QXI7_9CLOT|nr:DUF4363 family protein [Clostridium manihotivorum]QAA34631.1 hypothetical protein C1I91_25025 [Clostridium manihotivorum]
MKNTITSILIFLCLLGFIIYSHSDLIKICDDVSTKCVKIEDSIKNDKWDESYKLSVDLKEYIEKSFEPLSVYINHQDADILVNESLKLSQYTKYENKSEALSSIHLIKYSTKAIKALQTPKLENIF